MVRAISAVPWSKYEREGWYWALVTLTYHGCPLDGRTTKRHLRLFRERWARKWGARACGVWKREYQRRGSAHFHLLLLVDGSREIPEYRAWVARAWNECTGQAGDLAALAAGTAVERWRSDAPTGYFAKYAEKSGGKGYQNEAPQLVVHGGRWWGLWGARAEWTYADVTRETWCRMRRVLLRCWRRKLGRRRRADSLPRRLWLVGVREGSWRLADLQ